MKFKDIRVRVSVGVVRVGLGVFFKVVIFMDRVRFVVRLD